MPALRPSATLPTTRRSLALILTALLPALMPALADAGPAQPPGEQQAAVARLQVEAADGGDDSDDPWIIIENPLHGPIEVMVGQVGASAGSDALQTDPPLPVRAVVPALTRRAIARSQPSGTRQPHGLPRLRLTAVPGRPGNHDGDAEYGLPLQVTGPRATPLHISQAWNGSGSHATAEHRHAVDFAAPVGTPVLAARDGVVMQVESRFADNTASYSSSSDNIASNSIASPATLPASHDTDGIVERANSVRVLHDDGSMALYAHLQRGGVRVLPGQRVRRGQVIALSGNSGFSLGPHLHFAVQVNRGLRLESVPFRMFGPHGVLDFNAGIPEGSDGRSPPR